MSSPTPFPLKKPLRIGTRGSPLALAQAHETRARLVAAHNLDEKSVELVTIQTTGDRVLGQNLSEIGGKELFVKEIEAALLAGGIDMAVHSLKDMPVEQPEGLLLGAILERADPREALIVRDAGCTGVKTLRTGATIASNSVRRIAQIRNLRGDVKIVPLRGNVGTRLGKIAAGAADATFLAMAGLKRLGIDGAPIGEGMPAPIALGADEMLPAPGQGAICVECRCDDAGVRALLRGVHDRASALEVEAERAYLRRLDGSCATPIAGLARFDGDGLVMRGEILALDGSGRARAQLRGTGEGAGALGVRLAEALLAQGIFPA